MINKIMVHKKLLIGMIIFWFLFLSIWNPFLKHQTAEHKYGYRTDALLVLHGGETLQETFRSTLKGLKAVNIYSMHDESTSHDILMEIKTDGKIIYSKTVNTQEIGDVYQLDLQGVVSDDAGKDYTLMFTNLSTDNNPDSGITFNMHSDIVSEEDNAVFNGDRQNQSLNFGAEYQNKTLDMIYLGIWSLLILLSFICVIFLDERLEHNFLIIGCVIGLFYMFINPFPHAIDEYTHFFRAFCISQGDIHDSINENGLIGAEVSESYTDLLNVGFSIPKWYANREFYNKPFSETTEFYVNPYMSSVIPTDHAVSAAGIFAGRVLHLNLVWIIILSRLFDLIFYMVFAYYAIKFANHYKAIFFGVALIPWQLFSAASCSQDAILAGASLFMVSYCLHFYFNKDNDSAAAIGVKEMVLLLLPILFISSIKYLIYMPLVILFLFIPARLFKVKRGKMILIGITVLFSFVMFVYQVFLLKAFPFVEDRIENVDVAGQVKYVFSNIYYSYRNFGEYFFESLLDHVERTMARNSPMFLERWAGILIVLGAPLVTDKFKWNCNKEKKVFSYTLAGISFIVYGLVMAALYAGFTPIGEWGIWGLQTRYIFPVLPLICILLAGLPIKNEMKNCKIKYTVFLLMVNIFSFASYCLMGYNQ